MKLCTFAKFQKFRFQTMMGEGEGDSLWFTYLLNPSKLATDLAAGPSTQELQLLLKDLLTNLLNNQQAGFFTDNPQELWFAKSRERKSLVLRNLSLQVENAKQNSCVYVYFLNPHKQIRC